MMTIAGILKARQRRPSWWTGKPLHQRSQRGAGPGRLPGAGAAPALRQPHGQENLLMGAYLRRDKAGIAADMEEMFELFPIMRERIKQYAGTLSGGEQQMLAIARGLMGRPKHPAAGRALPGPGAADDPGRCSKIQEVRAAGHHHLHDRTERQQGPGHLRLRLRDRDRPDILPAPGRNCSGTRWSRKPTWESGTRNPPTRPRLRRGRGFHIHPFSPLGGTMKALPLALLPLLALAAPPQRPNPSRSARSSP